MAVVVIVNPTSGGRRGAAVLQEVLAAVPGPVAVRRTTRQGEAADIAGVVVANGVEAGPVGTLIVIGGDGTLSEVVDGMMRTQLLLDVPEAGVTAASWRTLNSSTRLPRIVYCPAGTGADFARLGLAVRPEQVSLAVASTEAPTDVDVGYVRCVRADCTTLRFFINVASVGLGSAVVRRAECLKRSWVAWLGGAVVFLLAAAIEVCIMAAVRVSVTPTSVPMEGAPRQAVASDDTYTTDATTMAFCNGRYFGGGMCISPESSFADRRLSVAIWRERVVGFALGLLSIYNGRAAKWRSSSTFDTADALVAPADPAPTAGGQREAVLPPVGPASTIQFEVDGELGCALPALVGVAPITLRFATVPVPAGSSAVAL